MNRIDRRAFSVTDLVVVLGLAALLAGAWARAAHSANRTSERIKCASNLSQIGRALIMYRNDNKDMMPRTSYVPGNLPTQYTGASAANPFGSGGPVANDVTAPLFLLIRTEDIETAAFVCPATGLTQANAGSARASSNFTSGSNLGYSLANMYPDRAAVEAGYSVRRLDSGDFAVAADMNPGDPGLTTVSDEHASPDALRGANSKNHDRDGQNVLYGDGHVEWKTHPFVGELGPTRLADNIYTVSGSTDGSVPTSSTIEGSPRWRGDSVLLPVATVDPSPGGLRGAVRSGWVWWVVGAVVVVSGGIVTLVLLRKKPKPAMAGGWDPSAMSPAAYGPPPGYEGQAGYEVPPPGYPPQGPTYGAPGGGAISPQPPRRPGPPPLPPRG